MTKRRSIRSRLPKQRTLTNEVLMAGNTRRTVARAKLRLSQRGRMIIFSWMKTYALESPPPLAAMVEEVKRGEEIVLTDHEKPVAKIIPPYLSETGNGKSPAPRAGCLKGFWMSPDVDAPLEDFKEYME